MSVVIVSWILALLAIFGLNYSREVRGEAQMVQLEVERHQLRAWARSGVEMACAEVDRAEIVGDGVARSPLWKKTFAGPLPCGRGRFAVGEPVAMDGREVWFPGIADEAARLPVAIADSTALANLPGFSPDGIDVLLRARDRAGEERMPPFELLSALDDRSREAAIRYLSRHGRVVNVNSASSEVLAAVGLPVTAVRKMLDWRAGSDGIHGTSDDQSFTSLDSADPGIRRCSLSNGDAAILAYLLGMGRLAVGSRFFSLVSRGWGTGVRGICDATVVLEKPEDGPTRVVEWTESWIN